MIVRRFPTDPATLQLLRAACQINDDTGRTHLLEFLAFGEEVVAREWIEEDVCVIEHAPGTEPFSPHAVIVDLVDEIERLRCGDAS